MCRHVGLLRAVHVDVPNRGFSCDFGSGGGSEPVVSIEIFWDGHGKVVKYKTIVTQKCVILFIEYYS